MIAKELVKKLWRYPLCVYYRSKLKVKQFTIISSDCIGGCLYHDLGLQFTSPTINLTIPKSLAFFERLEYYLQAEAVPDGFSAKGVPIARIEDLQIVGVHYRDHTELIEKWNERKKRVVLDNIIIMTSSRFISAEERAQFASLPYHKIMFTGDQPQNKFEVFMPAVANGTDLTAYCDVFGRRYFEKYLDCVSFLNESEGRHNGK